MENLRKPSKMGADEQLTDFLKRVADIAYGLITDRRR